MAESQPTPSEPGSGLPQPQPCPDFTERHDDPEQAEELERQQDA